jgi:nitrate reductase gamma subunit
VTAVLYLVILGSTALFLAASAVRAVRYARAPVHLRWELHPVPRGAAARARFMAVEILLLRSLRQANRPLWCRSFPFHAGLYLLSASLAAYFAAAAWLLVARQGSAPPLADAVAGLASWLGAAGLASTLAGALGLLHRRLTDPDLRACSTPGDYANLAFFLGSLGTVAAAVVTSPAGADGVRTALEGLLRWDTARHIPPLLASGLAACALLAAYIPFTHMSHFIGKYFTYHSVRWDETPIAGNRELAARITRQLASGPSWSAPHVGAAPTRTWADLASSMPESEPRP